MKKFFKEKLTDIKFSRAGPGHRLNEEQPKPMPKKTKPDVQPEHKMPSKPAQSAGAAALNRIESKDKKTTSSYSPIVQEVRRELQCAQASKTSSQTPPSGATATASSMPAQHQSALVSDIAHSHITVCMLCPICQRSYPHAAVHGHMEECLQQEYLKEPLSGSVHMIHTLCTDADKRTLCVDIICKYLDNIISNPTEQKYLKIRLNNKAFQERVSGIVGGALFLEAIGFHQQLLPHQDGETQFYVFSEDTPIDVDSLAAQRELLVATQPLKPVLDRSPMVFKPSNRLNKFDLSTDFYHLTLDEIRKEQKQKTESVEKESMLRTRAMKERDEIKMAVRHYRFVLLRIRFPDGLVLQGVFLPLDQLSEVRQFISSSLTQQQHTFSLFALGKPLKDDSASLARLNLTPAAVINLSWDSSSPTSPYLTDQLLAVLQDL